MKKINFSLNNHRESLKKLEQEKQNFKKAKVKSNSGKTLLETDNFDYLMDYCGFYYNFKVEVE